VEKKWPQVTPKTAWFEQPSIELLAQLGWETYNAYGEFEYGASPLGRETKGEVVLTVRLREALEKLNPELACRGGGAGRCRADPGSAPG